MKQITVPTSIDNSTKLQKLIDSTGNTPSKFSFETESIEINSKIRLYNFTEFDCQKCAFALKENVSLSALGNGIPLIAPKYPNAAEALNLHDFTFDGNRDTQNKVPPKNGKRWGLGYHNLIMLGSINNVSYNNSKNCEFYNIDYQNSLGDLLRVEGGTNITAHDITAKRGGHDVVCFVVNSGEIYNLKVDMCVNAGVRTRSAKNVKIHNCELNGGTGEAYSPGVEIQSTAENWISSNIEVYDNYIHDTYGPGIQIIGSVPNNGLVSVHHNLFVGCGAMPAANNRPVVGAVIFDGFPVEITYNTIVNSYGYGLAAGAYDATTTQKAESVIRRNIIVGTKKALNTQGIYSGTGIANLTGARNKITCSENCQYGNKTANHYQVAPTGLCNYDPCFIGDGDYRLKDDSPCVFEDYELGAFCGQNYHAPKLLPTVCVSKRTEGELQAFMQVLWDNGYLEKTDKISYENVSEGFEIPDVSPKDPKE